MRQQGTRVATIALAGVLLALLAVACTSGDGSDDEAEFTDPRFGPGIVEVDSCDEMPDTAVHRGGGFDESLDGSERRAIVSFFDDETGQSFALTLRTDRDLPDDCPDDILRLVEEPER